MLAVNGIDVYYGESRVLSHVGLSVGHYWSVSDPPAFSMAALALSLALFATIVSFLVNSPVPRIFTW